MIEHVSDDTKMLREVYRILKSSGYFYVSTVIKKWYGFWICWNKGFRLDPTHIREYRSKEEFLNLLENNGFEILRWKKDCMKYPVLDLLLRVLIKFGIINPLPDFYLKNELLKTIRDRVRLKIIGYEIIEVVGRVRK